MVKFTIEKVNDYQYELQDTDHKTYQANIEFYGLKEPLDKGDVIYVQEKMVPNFKDTVLSFGPLEEKYGREITSSEDEDVITIKTKAGVQIYLKRFYG